MDDQFKTLLKNKPIRHVINKLVAPNLVMQLRHLVDIDMVNFFVFARGEMINQVLYASNQENYFGKKYAWYVITKVTEIEASVVSSGICEDCSFASSSSSSRSLQENSEVFVRSDNASIVFAYPSMNPNISASQMVKSAGLSYKPLIDSSFYFDLILRTLVAVK